MNTCSCGEQLQGYARTQENDQFDAYRVEANPDVLAASRSDALNSITGFRPCAHDVKTPDGQIIIWGQGDPQHS
jgi:hypothetical protein